MSTNHLSKQSCLSCGQQGAERSRTDRNPEQGVHSGIDSLPRHSWTWSVATEHRQHELQTLLVDHKSKEVLLRREGECWVLPGLWIYYEDYEQIGEPSTTVTRIKELIGTVNMIVFLRSLWRKEMEVRIDDEICTLEKHVMLFETVRDPSLKSRGYEWVKLQDTDVYHLFDDASKAVREAMQWAMKDYPTDKLTAWQRPGWLRFATSWMEDVLRARFNVQLKQPVFMQRSSAYGVVLQADTEKGSFFLKCTLPLANDAAYTDALSGIVPKFVARPVAVDRDKQMMVTADYGEIVNVMRLSAEEKNRKTRDYVRLQKGTINRTDELIGAGFPDLRPVKLLECIDELPSDATFQAIGNTEEYASFARFFCKNKEGSKKLLKGVDGVWYTGNGNT